MLVKLFANILFIGLFLLPFIHWPEAVIPFEIPRVWFFNRWVEILMIVGLLSIVVNSKRQHLKKIDSILTLSVITFIIVAIISSIVGVDFGKSFWGNYYRSDGLFTLFHLASLFLLLILFWQDKWKNYLAYSISSSAFIISFWVIVLGTRLYILGDTSVHQWIDGAIGVSFGQPKFLSGYLLVTLPFTVYLFRTSTVKLSRLFLLISITVQTVGILFTKSWGGILGMGLLVVTTIILSTKFKKMLVFSLGLLFLAATSFVIYSKLYQSRGFIAESRMRIFRNVFIAALQRPIFGWGWANVDYAFESVIWPLKLEKDVYVDKAHSTLLEVFTTTGIIGFISYLVVLNRLGKIFVIHLKRKRRSSDYIWFETLFTVFILYIFHSQTNVISIGEEIFFWLVLGTV